MSADAPEVRAVVKLYVDGTDKEADLRLGWRAA